MKTDAGVILGIRNRVLIDESVSPRYTMSRIHVTAPAGLLEWLNRRVIVGTPQSARPGRQAVIIRACQVEAA